MLQKLLPTSTHSGDNVIAETIHWLTDNSGKVMAETIHSLLLWAAGRSPHSETSDRLRFIADAPLPWPTPSIRSLLPGHSRSVKQYAPDAVEAMKREQPKLWEWFS